jgi:hypothetical protein
MCMRPYPKNDKFEELVNIFLLAYEDKMKSLLECERSPYNDPSTLTAGITVFLVGTALVLVSLARQYVIISRKHIPRNLILFYYHVHQLVDLSFLVRKSNLH